MDADGWTAAAVARIAITEPEPPAPAPKRHETPAADDEGCGCRVPGRPAGGIDAGALGLLIALAAIGRTRRRSAAAPFRG